MQNEPTGAIYKKSSYSGNSGNCVAVARNLPGVAAVRDSKNPEGGALVFTVAQWRAFTDGIAAGELVI